MPHKHAQAVECSLNHAFYVAITCPMAKALAATDKFCRQYIRSPEQMEKDKQIALAYNRGMLKFHRDLNA